MDLNAIHQALRQLPRALGPLTVEDIDRFFAGLGSYVPKLQVSPMEVTPSPQSNVVGVDEAKNRVRRLLFKHIFPRHPCFTDLEMDLAIANNYGAFSAAAVYELMQKAAIGTPSPVSREAGAPWQRITTVPTDERLIIVGSYNAKHQWCSEVWSTRYVREQFEKSAMGFFDKSPHLKWLPTHWMEMPTPPALNRIGE